MLHIRVGDSALVKQTGCIGLVTAENGHACKISGVWYHVEDVEKSSKPNLRRSRTHLRSNIYDNFQEILEGLPARTGSALIAFGYYDSKYEHEGQLISCHPLGLITWPPLELVTLAQAETAMTSLIAVQRLPARVGDLPLSLNTDTTLNRRLHGGQSHGCPMGVFKMVHGKSVEKMLSWDCKDQGQDTLGLIEMASQLGCDHLVLLGCSVVAETPSAEVSASVAPSGNRFHDFAAAILNDNACQAGTALVAYGHSSWEGDGFFKIPHGKGIITYTAPMKVVSVRDEDYAVRKMTVEARIPKTVGPYELLPNSGVTPNYFFQGDDRLRGLGSGEGLYKVVCGASAEQLEQWDSGRRVSVKQLFALLDVHGCDYLVAMGCKGSGHFKDMLEHDPTWVRGWIEVGREGGCAINGRMYSAEECQIEARRCAIEAVRTPQDCTSVWEDLADLSGNEGEYTKLGCYQEILRIDPEYARVWDLLGDLGGGKVGEQHFSIIECYEEAFRLDPDDPNRCLMLARKAYVAGEPGCIHEGVFCDGCRDRCPWVQNPSIVGMRHQALGIDYDLCQACYDNIPEEEQKEFRAIDRSELWCKQITEASQWWRLRD